ncbi:MAG: hypothetical protein J7513_13135 [Solirubrobacteraceae bacterium]|nr:hypothetical protein [Solirubrobacteraceae bacterium]
MILASLIGNAFTLLAALLAIWSLWWIVRGSLTNTEERNAEDEARLRVAEGKGWGDGPQPVPFSDEELARLSDALAPSDPAEAGIEVRPREPESRRWPWSNRRP